MENVVFTYQRQKEDIIKHNVWQLFWRNRIIRVLTIGFPLLGVFFLFDSIMRESNPIVYIAISYLILYPVFNYFLIVRRVNRWFNDPNVVIDITTFDYSQTGITVSSDKGEIFVGYDRVVKVYNTKEYIYVNFDDKSNVMVRKSILREDQVQFILDILKEKSIEKACNY
jgi:hypothetical protein